MSKMVQIVKEKVANRHTWIVLRAHDFPRASLAPHYSQEQASCPGVRRLSGRFRSSTMMSEGLKGLHHPGAEEVGTGTQACEMSVRKRPTAAGSHAAARGTLSERRGMARFIGGKQCT